MRLAHRIRMSSRIASIILALSIIMASTLIFQGIMISFNLRASDNHPMKENAPPTLRRPEQQLSPEETQVRRHASLVAGCHYWMNRHGKTFNAGELIGSSSSSPFDIEKLVQNPHLLQQFIYNDQHKVIYCYVPKVASTPWKKLLAVLRGSLRDLPLETIPTFLVHFDALYDLLSDLPPDEIRRRLDTYTTFLFVRHPLERLLSAYMDKFLLITHDSLAKKFAAEILSEQRPWLPNPESVPPMLANITFPEFAAWASNPSPTTPGPNEEHWRPVMELCHPCSVRYDIIGRLETLDRDAALVLRTTNISHPRFPTGHSSSTDRHVAAAMQSLPPDVAERLLRKYEADFDVFGYQRTWTNLSANTP